MSDLINSENENVVDDSINPDTQQQYYSGTKEDLVVFCKALNIDSGRLSAMSNINVKKFNIRLMALLMECYVKIILYQ